MSRAEQLEQGAVRRVRPDAPPAMTQAEFTRIAERVLAQTGIVLKEHKRQMVYSRMTRRLRALGLTSFTAYLDHLDAATDGGEARAFVNAVTTNLTSFFREDHHFEDFEREVLPHLIARRDGRLRLWSAGCSSGEEPYTLAMSLLHACRDAPPVDLRILATDIDTDMLDRARAGIYTRERTAKIPRRFSGYLLDGPDAETARIAPQVQALITFKELNLIGPWPVRGPFDVIFCRNVLIYFDGRTKAALIDRFADLLTPGGALYLGHSESLLDEHPLLESLGATVYRRRR